MARMTALTRDEIDAALPGLAGWTFEAGRLLREYRFSDFPEALAFVNRVGALAERENHHPDIDLRYNRVLLGWWTHDAEGITKRDLRLAELVNSFGSAQQNV